MIEPQPLADHPHNDPGDGRTECEVCGKWVHECIHSCKGVPVTDAAMSRWYERNGIVNLDAT
jgi:hypothetical protein